MADQEHLDILRRGIREWNRWYHDHQTIKPDFSGAHLNFAYLEKVDFEGANLEKADFEGANLIEACLKKADLKKANLANAELEEADLERANLTGTRLEKAHLIGTRFTTATFKKTILTQANMGRTVFEDVDLSQVKGLETVRHYHPSTLGLDTIIRSHGNIPKSFLRGAGVPEAIIEQIPALVSSLKPIDYYSCFISYSSKDEDFAKRLYTDLQSNGIRCWFAPEDMRIGDKIRYRIDESIRLYDKLLLVLSEHSVASQWVEHEVETSIGQELEGKPNVLFPIRLDQAIMDSKTGWASHIRLTRHIG